MIISIPFSDPFKELSPPNLPTSLPLFPYLYTLLQCIQSNSLRLCDTTQFYWTTANWTKIMNYNEKLSHPQLPFRWLNSTHRLNNSVTFPWYEYFKNHACWLTENGGLRTSESHFRMKGFKYMIKTKKETLCKETRNALSYVEKY